MGECRINNHGTQFYPHALSSKFAQFYSIHTFVNEYETFNGSSLWDEGDVILSLFLALNFSLYLLTIVFYCCLFQRFPSTLYFRLKFVHPLLPLSSFDILDFLDVLHNLILCLLLSFLVVSSSQSVPLNPLPSCSPAWRDTCVTTFLSAVCICPSRSIRAIIPQHIPTASQNDMPPVPFLQLFPYLLPYIANMIYVL